MSSPLLFKSSRDGRTVVEITPARAGWDYTGLKVLRLAADEGEAFATDGYEYGIVVLSGTVDATVDGVAYPALGERASVFEHTPPAVVYVPPQRRVVLRASRAAEVALCSALGDDASREVAVLDRSAMRYSTRGTGANARQICDLLPETNPVAARLLLVEVVTPSGHSSSYPPHKHDSDHPPDETRLEEIYYHRLNPPQGFALQRIYTDDRDLDEACAVEDRDAVIVPRGYHPVVVPYGYDLYYLNVMAGRHRHWAFANDPDHQWLLQAQETR